MKFDRTGGEFIKLAGGKLKLPVKIIIVRQLLTRKESWVKEFDQGEYIFIFKRGLASF